MDRKTIFGIILMLLFGFACLRFYSKCTGGKSFFGSNVAPQNEWKDILIGKWEFESNFRYQDHWEKYFGEVEYLPNGKFIRTITIKYSAKFKRYEGSTDYDLYEEYLIAGGIINGNWKIENDAWIETKDDCEISISKRSRGETASQKDICKQFEKARYGTSKDTYSERKIEIFNENKILIKQKIYSQDSDNNTYSFKKMK